MHNPAQTMEYLEGKVARVERFGAFVDVSGRGAGLVRPREISWSVRRIDPRDVLTVGQSVRMSSPQTKVALMTGEKLPDPQDQLESKAISKGAIGFWRKPIGTDRLIEIFKRCFPASSTTSTTTFRR